jgi:hypothetical protein
MEKYCANMEGFTSFDLLAIEKDKSRLVKVADKENGSPKSS